MQAGAPPDAFAAKGQNWRFPIYNWQRMKEDGFEWWKRRFAQMSHYFDAFRIDHILGFFRIWGIPQEAMEGILGYFVPALPAQTAEFAALGIKFNYERFHPPLHQRCRFAGNFWRMRRRREAGISESSDSKGTYSLKTEFATQWDVERYFAAPENKEAHGPINSAGPF